MLRVSTKEADQRAARKNGLPTENHLDRASSLRQLERSCGLSHDLGFSDLRSSTFQPPKQVLEHIRSTSNAQTSVATESKLLFRLGQQSSKDAIREVRRRDDKPSPLLSNVHSQATCRDVSWRTRAFHIAVVAVEATVTAVVYISHAPPGAPGIDPERRSIERVRRSARVPRE